MACIRAARAAGEIARQRPPPTLAFLRCDIWIVSYKFTHLLCGLQEAFLTILGTVTHSQIHNDMQRNSTHPSSISLDAGFTLGLMNLLGCDTTGVAHTMDSVCLRSTHAKFGSWHSGSTEKEGIPKN